MLLSSPELTLFDIYKKAFFKKATIVMYLLSRIIGEVIFSKVLSSLLCPESSDSPRTSTDNFFNKIKMITHKDLLPFMDHWINYPEYPHLNSGFWFDYNKNNIEVTYSLQPTSVNSEIDGTLVLRVAELDGEDKLKYFDFKMRMGEQIYDCPCQFRSKKRSLTASGGPTQEGEQASEDIPTSIQWIRFDPSMDWPIPIRYHQPLTMWINQLCNDNDVIAQIEAINFLTRFPTKETINTLNGVLNNPKKHYLVRMRAALVIGLLTSAANEWIGVDYLLKYYKSNYQSGEMTTNNFDDYSKYSIQKTLIFSLSLIQGLDGRTPSDITEFLLNLLKNNDNSKNQWDDSVFRAISINSLANLDSSVTQEGTTEVETILKQLFKFMDNEKSEIGNQYIIRVCLSTIFQLQRLGKFKKDFGIFKEYLFYGNPDMLRVTAAQCILYLGIHSSLHCAYPDTSYLHALSILLPMATSDPSPFFRHSLLRSFVNPPDPLPYVANGVWCADLAAQNILRNRRDTEFSGKGVEEWTKVLKEEGVRSKLWDWMVSPAVLGDSLAREIAWRWFLLLPEFVERIEEPEEEELKSETRNEGKGGKRPKKTDKVKEVDQKNRKKKKFLDAGEDEEFVPKLTSEISMEDDTLKVTKQTQNEGIGVARKAPGKRPLSTPSTTASKRPKTSPSPPAEEPPKRIPLKRPEQPPPPPRKRPFPLPTSPNSQGTEQPPPPPRRRTTVVPTPASPPAPSPTSPPDTPSTAVPSPIPLSPSTPLTPTSASTPVTPTSANAPTPLLMTPLSPTSIPTPPNPTPAPNADPIERRTALKIIIRSTKPNTNNPNPNPNTSPSDLPQFPNLRKITLFMGQPNTRRLDGRQRKKISSDET
uniref:Transcription initiation factor TFIID subunit 2 n=1 Tax=Arcella intermedia TaxID=1963864 RepID=A0A6B2KXQ6_9EUKA